LPDVDWRHYRDSGIETGEQSFLAKEKRKDRGHHPGFVEGWLNPSDYFQSVII
jgi:hypothetical protein